MPDGLAEQAFPRLDPAEAIAWFRAKGFAIGFDWRDVWQEEHARGFTVAKAMSRDLLEDIRAEVDRALAEGTTLADFSKALRPKLQARGWWGKALREDPQTGETKVVQLGSPARLRTIYETNMRTSYAAGKWQRIERTAKSLPFLRYVSVMDGREREQHHDWHGTILPLTDPWWDTHYPPCGWGCRCDAQQLSQRMMDRRGYEVNEPRKFPQRDYVNKRTGEVTKLEQGIDPGWAYNVGKAPLDGLTPAPRVTGGGSDLGELQAMLSEADYEPVRGFFAAFGLDTRAAALRGTIWTDPAGWPMAISAGLLRGADGHMVRLDAAQDGVLAAAARVLTAPDTIGWVWISGKDGRALLVRRYRSAAGMVDVAGSFWRWHAGGSPAMADSAVVWTADHGELQAYDPHQARHPKGSRDGGRFRSTGRGAALASLEGGGHTFFRTALLGTVSAGAAERAKAQGVEGLAGRGVTLEHTFGKHIMQGHGPGKETRRDQRPVTAKELMHAHASFNAAHSFALSDRPGQKFPRVHARSRMADGGEAQIFADLKGRNVSIVSMYVKKGS